MLIKIGKFILKPMYLYSVSGMKIEQFIGFNYFMLRLLDVVRDRTCAVKEL